MDTSLAAAIQGSILRFAALLPALTLHEFAHAWSAVKAGDPTPEMQGRLTLNPFAHLDPMGTVAILLFPIGWAKPVQMNPANFRYPSRDIITTSALGPISNILQGIFWGLLLRFLLAVAPGLVLSDGFPSVLGGMLGFMSFLNFVLALFNLIPLGPLDGHHILQYLLPYEKGLAYGRFNRQYGMAVLFGIIALEWITEIRVLSVVLVLPAQLAGRLVTGVNPLGMAQGGGILFTIFDYLFGGLGG